MTVIVSKPAINLREELASLRNQGGYAEQQFWFDNLVTNGTFDSDLTGWDNDSVGTGTATVSSGQVSLTRVDLSNKGVISQSHTLENGKVYTVTFELISGSVQVKYKGGSGSLSQTFNGENWNSLSTAGVYQTTFTATGTDGDIELGAISNGVTAVLDNVSVYEVDANDDVVHRMPKGWVPKDVFEDGLLQREGAAHDYEVVYDGFDYYVKPTVAPSASTETCVIGVRA